MTPQIPPAVGEVALSQDEPLLVDLTMFPLKPTPTKVLFPKVTPMRWFVVELSIVALSQDEPLSVDLKMFPERPTATNTPELDDEEVVVVSLSVVVVSSVVELLDVLLFLAQEMTVKLKRDIRIMYKTLFIFLLHQ